MEYEVTQQQANEILYKAWEAFDMYDSLLAIDGMGEAAHGYRKAAQAYYECWTMIVGYEFTNGLSELRKMSAEDFEEVISKQKAEILVDQFEEYSELFV